MFCKDVSVAGMVDAYSFGLLCRTRSVISYQRQHLIHLSCYENSAFYVNTQVNSGNFLVAFVTNSRLKIYISTHMSIEIDNACRAREAKMREDYHRKEKQYGKVTSRIESRV
jgi:hypothetical protein